VLSWASFPSRVCSNQTSGPVSRVDPRGAGKPACLVNLREHSRLVSFTRPVLRSQGHAPGIRRLARSIEPRPPPSGGDPAGVRLRRTDASRQLQPTRGTSALTESPSIDWSVLPAPPLGGAPRLPRPSVAFPAKGTAAWAPETLLSGPAGGPTSYDADQLLWGSTPHRNDSPVRACAPHGLYALRALRPYGRFASGETLRRRNAFGPSLRRSFARQAGLAPVPSLEICLVSVARTRNRSAQSTNWTHPQHGRVPPLGSPQAVPPL